MNILSNFFFFNTFFGNLFFFLFYWGLKGKVSETILIQAIQSQ